MKQPGPTRHRIPVLAPLALALVVSACSGGAGSGSSSSSLPDCIPGSWLLEVDADIPPCVDLGIDGVVALASVMPGEWEDTPELIQEGFALSAPGWDTTTDQGVASFVLYQARQVAPIEQEWAALVGTRYLPAQDITVFMTSDVQSLFDDLPQTCDELQGSGPYTVVAGRWLDGSYPPSALLCTGRFQFRASRVQGLVQPEPEHEALPIPVSGLLEVEGSERRHPVRGVYDPELRVGEALVLGLEEGRLELIGQEEGGLVFRAASPRLAFAPAVGVGRGVSLAEGRLLLDGELSVPARLRLRGLEQSAPE
jgi:hypothetical protein